MPTTQNNTKNVSYGKFKTGAYFFIAPYGTALPPNNPTDLTDASVVPPSMTMASR